LIGRSEEMRTIEAAITASDGSGVVVCGAAGVGKSRMAREALSAAATRGCETRWTVGTSSALAIPLGAFTAWAPSGVTDTFQLLRGVIESLTAASSAAKVVLGVDDVHLLDDLSAFVVHQIVQRGAAKVILTARDDEPIPGAIQDSWTAGQFERLDVKPLSLDETTTLLSATLAGSVDPDAVQRIWELTRGNGLYLRGLREQRVRAADWQDKADRMQRLLRLHYGENGFQLQMRRTGSGARLAIEAYFEGHLDAIERATESREATHGRPHPPQHDQDMWIAAIARTARTVAPVHDPD